MIQMTVFKQLCPSKKDSSTKLAPPSHCKTKIPPNFNKKRENSFGKSFTLHYVQWTYHIGDSVRAQNLFFQPCSFSFSLQRERKSEERIVRQAAIFLM